MKNIEKYTNTKDALEAWDKYHDGGGDMPFAAWAEQEAVPLTLLEAATEVKETWNAKIPYGALSRVATTISVLADAIEHEKKKPVRNCDVGTAEEQMKRFNKFCFPIKCSECQLYKDEYLYTCILRWAQMPYEEGGAK